MLKIKRDFAVLVPPWKSDICLSVFMTLVLSEFSPKLNTIYTASDRTWPKLHKREVNKHLGSISVRYFAKENESSQTIPTKVRTCQSPKRVFQKLSLLFGVDMDHKKTWVEYPRNLTHKSSAVEPIAQSTPNTPHLSKSDRFFNNLWDNFTRNFKNQTFGSFATKNGTWKHSTHSTSRARCLYFDMYSFANFRFLIRNIVLTDMLPKFYNTCFCVSWIQCVNLVEFRWKFTENECPQHSWYF